VADVHPRRLLRLASLAVAIAACATAALLSSGDGDAGHRVTVTVASATNVVAGQAIRQAGVTVGRIVSIKPTDQGRAARLELALENRAWPLRSGTSMHLRWAGTANFGNRYIALKPGRGAAIMVKDGGVFPAKAFHLPVEIDQLLTAFPARTRAQLTRLLTVAGPAFARARPGLRKSLLVAPTALEQAGAVLQDLDADHRALVKLVTSTASVLTAVDDSRPGTKTLLEGAAGTFDAIADETTATKTALQRLPNTLRQTRTTLALADNTLQLARDVTTRIAPGVDRVRAIAKPLDSVLATVRRVGPDATATLRSVRGAAPDLNPLLASVTRRAPQLKSIAGQAIDNLKCIRPFTPDILSYFSNWGDFLAGTDGKDKLIRAQVQHYAPAFSNVTPINASQAKQLFTGLEYGFPRPPGYNAGQPWFLPECGAGVEALDPNKDPEIRESSKVFDLPRLTPIVSAPRGRGR